MLAVIQRVTHANISVDEKTITNIGHGILAFIGIEKTDSEKQADYLLEKILNYRIFNDDVGKMNRSLQEVRGELLLVSQFTIVADTKSGTRPGFSTAMPPEQSKVLFEYLVNYAKNTYRKVANGKFGANMQVSLCNDGPVTFLLKT